MDARKSSLIAKENSMKRYSILSGHSDIKPQQPFTARQNEAKLTDMTKSRFLKPITTISAMG
jgi:hypothetical protein